MSGKIWLKFIISGIVLAWAIMNLVPMKDVPYSEYVEQTSTDIDKEFANIVADAKSRIEKKEFSSLYIALREMAKEEGYDYAKYFPSVKNINDIRNINKRNDVLLRKLLKDSQSNLKLGLDLKGGVAFTLKLAESATKDKSDYQNEAQLEEVGSIMSQRLNAFGVAEPIIRSVGTDKVEIQLAGIDSKSDPEVIDSLQKPARLEFRLVHRTQRPTSIKDMNAPIGYEALAQENENKQTGEITESLYFVKRLPEATGKIIESSYVTQDNFGGFAISMQFTSDGKNKFADITKRIADQNQSAQSIGQLAIVLDGKLRSAPSVREQIFSNGAEITGDFDQREAIDLSNVLNNPLDVPLTIDEKYEVGPSLAEDSRNSSIQAAMWGGGLVVVFMVIYYGLGGIVAVISILCNILIVLGVMASIGATITLPGVAALVLTVGMAVDANILIFERIREELRNKKSARAALLGGYEKALSTIVDANVTTLITAGILIWLGTGPVKGFGVTLTIGICASMFCALIVSRFLLEILVDKLGVNKVLGLDFGGNFNIPFLDFRKVAFSLSWVIVIAGAVMTVTNKDKILGIDFTGGDEIAVEFNQKVQIQDILGFAEKTKAGEVFATYQTDLASGVEKLKIQTELGKGKEFFNALSENYPQAELEVIGETVIGASVSQDIQKNAMISVAVALIGILLYVALRFEFGYGIGAVVATIHDVLMTIGIFAFAGGQFSAPMLAAILMIVGYSINDTIVVFDRIREELLLNPVTNLRKIVTLAINRVISRSILTSITTLMAASALYFYGAGVVTDFAFVFIVGILTGTFSSIFIASPVFYWWHKGSRSNVEEKEDSPQYEWSSSTKASQ